MAFSLLSAYENSAGSITVQNPATGAAVMTIREYSAGDVEAIVKKAQASLPAWSKRTGKDRAAVLKRWNDLILENQEELAQIITAECGKPLAEARGEVAYGASFVEWFAEEGKRAYGDVIPTHNPASRIVVMKQPIGVVAAITPWNFPVAMITRKVAPALAAGCPMIVKPAEATPLSALAIEELARRAGIPDDVFRIVTTSSPREVGEVLTTHPLIKKISFTGSTAVGKILMRQSADTVKKVSMELGGNAPFIVFDDADLDAAVEGALISKYRNAGQTCVCANRFYIQDGIYDAFITRFAERVASLRVGDGSENGTDVGPLINAAAVEKVNALVKSAVTDGARTVLGGTPDARGGNFYAPTLLADITPDMDIARAEIFGPVATVFRFTSEDDVVAQANDTPYGLAAYFYARDLGRVWRVAEALEYGMVGINEGILSTEVAPFGGIKESGVGREGSRYGIDEYMEMKYCLFGGLGN
ncbi:NAD-dependent succinate-semialdehyde dehydrogenase [Kordiimonas aquimaris]|uniref:NAD-dependent succinate-semialdehyde dehydrogenase n=1 Tax=Kordiimonas aquimaris TaxID=707591 RepID=UPI0021D393C7|nr:NAD-dependent succinate-semialdehyde dehydrogenase [Kordiimonas aquimaris]